MLWPLKPAQAQTIYANLGPLSLPIPWDNVNVVYLRNVTTSQNLVGGEMVFAVIKAGSYQNNPLDIDLTAGGVVDPTGNNLGTAFAGVNLDLPSTLPYIGSIGAFKPGLFGGYAINQHQWQFGIKAAVNIFNG